MEQVRKRVTVLGATGTVGRAALDLIGRNPERFSLVCLSANRDVEGLAGLAVLYGAQQAVLADGAMLPALRDALSGTGIVAAAGAEALAQAAEVPADLVISAIVGVAGLVPTWRALEQGRTVALANKEALVSAGALMMNRAARRGARILPLDSEHNAIFQCLEPHNRDSITKMVLTASGGPLRELDRQAMARVTPQQAVAHPNWSMGAKISVDSATLMNKGLELIEAHHLFDMPESKIEVVVHPESVIHSLVVYEDGSQLAQLGPPDMRVPLAHALAWPKRMQAPVADLDLVALGKLHFEAPDLDRFPALALARDALAAGGSYTAALNAANEVAVAAFLSGKIGFLGIEGLVRHMLDTHKSRTPSSLEEVLALDAEVRVEAEANLSHLA